MSQLRETERLFNSLPESERNAICQRLWPKPAIPPNVIDRIVRVIQGPPPEPWRQIKMPF
jgi:hypothetical protein